jgi:transcriptional regulator
MYVPPHFRQGDLAELHALIRSARLATLVTVAGGAPLVSHVPMLIDEGNGPNGTLQCHVARANPHWRAIAAETEALAIFLGPDAYVSPSWYESKREHGKVVPTWNYMAVHAYGPMRVIEDPQWLRALVQRLTLKHEADRPAPWAVEDAPGAFIESQLRAIVGLEIRIDRLDGKWKLSQNRSAADVAGVVEALESSPDALDRATAAAMRDLHGERSEHS